DSIRVALGQQKISYLGYSYGTYLGQVYATMFGDRVRRMALDSTVDPRGAWYADNITQDRPWEARMQAFFSWVAAHAGFYQLGTTRAQVQQAWYQARAQLASHPISGPDGPVIGPAEFDDTMLQGGYSNSVWPGLAAALAAYLHTGSAKAMINEYRAFGKENENLFAVYNAVECSDVNWPRNWAKWDADARRVYRTAPVRAWDNTSFHAACAFWPVPSPGRPPGHPRLRPPSHPHDPGHTRCRHPVPGRAGGAQAAAQRADGRGRGRREPRAVAVPASQPVREQLPQHLPGERRGAAPRRARQRHLLRPAAPLAELLSRPALSPGIPPRER